MKKTTLLFSFWLCLNTLFALPPTVSKNIKIDQFGYRKDAKKICVISNPITGFNNSETFTPSSNYQVRQWADDAVVFTGSPTAWNGGAEHTQSGDKCWWFDFSSLTTAGDYYVFDVVNNVGSYRFSIGDDVYNNVLKNAVRMYFHQRSGFNKTSTYAGIWADGAAFLGTRQDLDCRLVTDSTNASTSKDLSGGWFDAGDFNKYVNFTYSTLHDLLFAYQENPTVWFDNYNIPESGNGIPDLLDEVKWELDWLLKMQQADGSVLSKVSVNEYQSTSPASADRAYHYYGRASVSSALTVASVFAHAAIIYRSLGNPTMTAYGNMLETKAILSYNWAVTNFNTAPHSVYDNAGFRSANSEEAGDVSYKKAAKRTCAAAMLYAATGNTAYRDYFDANYNTIQPQMWGYWYAFENTFCNIMAYYTSLSGATSGVSTAIRNSYKSSIDYNDDFYPSQITQNDDPYRAYMKSNDYTWGSNMVKTHTGTLYYNMKHYNIGGLHDAEYKGIAEDFIHYLHGINPLNLVYLTNASSFGAENSVVQMYHNSFGEYSTNFNMNTAPAYLTGGANGQYFNDTPTLISPPEGQPTQKAFKDWNTGYPESSWQLTEPAIYYQASYVRLLSKFVGTSSVLSVDLQSFSAQKVIGEKKTKVNWKVVNENKVKDYQVQRSDKNNSGFQNIGVAIKANNQSTYTMQDTVPLTGTNYYRLKITNQDNSVKYSDVQSVLITSLKELRPDLGTLSLFPNPTVKELNISLTNIQKNSQGEKFLQVIDVLGKVVLTQSIIINNNEEWKGQIDVNRLANGIYHLQISDDRSQVTMPFSVVGK